MVVKHVLPNFLKNVPIYCTSGISSSIEHITLERDCKGSSNGKPHRVPTRCSQIVEGKLGYNIKLDETTRKST